MKCMSCEEDVNSKFKHAIAKNECPFCGLSILEEALSGILSKFQEVFIEFGASPYRVQIEEWLHDNVGFVHVSAIPNYRKAQNKQQQQQYDEEYNPGSIKIRPPDSEEYIAPIVSEKASQTAKRAGLDIGRHVSKYADIAAKINNPDSSISESIARAKQEAFQEQTAPIVKQASGGGHRYAPPPSDYGDEDGGDSGNYVDPYNPLTQESEDADRAARMMRGFSNNSGYKPGGYVPQSQEEALRKLHRSQQRGVNQIQSGPHSSGNGFWR